MAPVHHAAQGERNEEKSRQKKAREKARAKGNNTIKVGEDEGFNSSGAKLRLMGSARSSARNQVAPTTFVEDDYKILYDPHKSKLPPVITPECDIMSQRLDLHVNQVKARQMALWKYYKIVHPGSGFKTRWDIVLGVAIVYSVCIIPYRMGFEHPAPIGAKYFDYLIDVFFFLDICVNFTTAYGDEQSDGLTVSRPRIAAHYLKGWFLVDFASTVPIDTIVEQVAGGGDNFRSIKLVRVLRLVKLLKLVRLLKLSKFMSEYEDLLDINPAYFGLAKMLTGFIFVSHLLACIWHFLAIMQLEDGVKFDPCGSDDQPPNWIEAYAQGQDYGGCENLASIQSRYIAALYWTVATMTAVGYGDVYAITDTERVYSMIVQIFGAMFFGFIIGDIGTLLKDTDVKQSRGKERLDRVKDYMRSRNLPKILQRKIKAFLVYSNEKSSGFDEEEILEDMSSNLRTEVLGELHSDVINNMELFKGMAKKDATMIVAKLVPMFQLPGDMIVKKTSIAKELFFLRSGVVEDYITVPLLDAGAAVSKTQTPAQLAQQARDEKQSRQDQADGFDLPANVNDPEEAGLHDIVISSHKEGSHFGDIGLLCDECGGISPLFYQAREHCEMLVIEREDLLEILEGHPEVADKLKKIAKIRYDIIECAKKEFTPMVERGELVPVRPIHELPDDLLSAQQKAQAKVLLQKERFWFWSRPSLERLTAQPQGAEGYMAPSQEAVEKDQAESERTGLPPTLKRVNSSMRMKPRTSTVTNSGTIQDEVEIGFAKIHPDAKNKTRWDMLLGVFIVYSVLAVPVRIGFDSEASGFGAVFDNIVDIFFFLDMCVSFRTCFFNKAGRLVHDTKSIVIHYLKGWFFVDFASTVPIDLLVQVATGGNNQNVRVLKMIRILRLARLLKLTRLAKLDHVITMIEDEYDISPAVMALFKLSFKMYFVAHFLACFWAYTWSSKVCDDTILSAHECGPMNILASSIDGDDGGDGMVLRPKTLDELGTTPGWLPNWMDLAGDESKANMPSQYLAAIYWAFTTMTTVGYGDLLPENDTERLYCCLGMMVGAIIFGYVLSSMSTLVARMESKSTDAREKMRMIKQYTKERKFSKDLSSRITKYFKYMSEYKSSFEEEAILGELSGSLREEVIMTVNRHIISKIPIFEGQNNAFISYVMSLMKSELCVPGDYFFKEGDIGTNLYFLIEGIAEVVVDAGVVVDSVKKEKVYRRLKEGDYFGEIAVVMDIPRTASVRGFIVCSAFALSKSSLDFMAKYYPRVTESIKKFIEQTQDRFDGQGGMVYDLPDSRKAEVDRATTLALDNAREALEKMSRLLSRGSGSNEDGSFNAEDAERKASLLGHGLASRFRKNHNHNHNHPHEEDGGAGAGGAGGGGAGGAGGAGSGGNSGSSGSGGIGDCSSGSSSSSSSSSAGGGTEPASPAPPTTSMQLRTCIGAVETLSDAERFQLIKDLCKSLPANKRQELENEILINEM